jgi:hypothetical protein
VEDPTTIALNLTFFGTLGVAFAMFIGLFAVFVLTLVIAGVGRLTATIAFAVAHGLSRAAGAAAAAVRTAPPAPAARAAASAGMADTGTPSPNPPSAGGPSPVQPGRKETPQLSADWTAAVARAEARASAPTTEPAKTEAAPGRKAG